VIAEIPCLLSDAPCRFPFAAVYHAKRASARVMLVNGWIYGYAPPSRLDAIERKMFGRDYLRLMDLITVQNDEVRNRLIAEGADPSNVHVTGNTKFDAVVRPLRGPVARRSEALLRGIIDGGRPCVVAGCVTDYEDQLLVLDAFKMVIERNPSALLVLAPRHPENADMMTRLDALLRESRLSHVFRSRIPDTPLGADTQVLVLDTIGELKDFYAASTVSYVGRDHNILEPLTFGKPVTISPGWDATYPSYPVYRLLRGMACVQELLTPSEHATRWTQALAMAVSGGASTSIDGELATLRGASQRNLQLAKRTLLQHGRRAESS
jgi:3-deoxy-D-manno-octulosonic-acid transferase